MAEKPKKTKKVTTKTSKVKTPPPLDIGLPKSGLVSGKKSMDIVPRGKTLPSSSAKPIIVSNRTIVKDPMAPPELTEESAEKPPKKRKLSTKIVIEPLHDAESEKIVETPSDESTKPSAPVIKDPEPVLEEPEEPKETTKEDAPEIELETSEEPEGLEDAEGKEPEEEAKKDDIDVDETADDIEKSTKPKPEEIEREKAEKRAEEAAELIASKKYFLPINSVKKRRSARFAWILVGLILIVLGGIGLLDAGLLDFMKAPTDFIKD